MERTLEDTKSFWNSIIRNADGTINEEQVYKELADFSFMIGEVPKVYMHITDNLLSKPNYYAYGVISKADETYQRQYIEQAKGFIDGLIEEELLMESDKIAALEELERHF